MKISIKEWDASEYLDGPEMMKEYLRIMLEENGMEGFKRALGDVAKAKGMGEIAQKTNLSRQNLYKALSPNGNPKFDTVKKVIDALGYKLTVV